MIDRHHHRNHHHQQQQQREARIEKTLEDLFEEAVESLRGDDVEYHLKDSVTGHAQWPISHQRRLRSSDNWERQIYDSELHDDDRCRCRLRLHATTYDSRDASRVSRAVALVQKVVEKTTPDFETTRKKTQQSGVESELLLQDKPHTYPKAKVEISCFLS